MNRRRESGWLVAIAGAVALTALADPLSAQNRRVPETYTAVTANMVPADVELKMDILSWSDADERKAVIDALQAAEPAAALKSLPSKGVVWRVGGAVGFSIKYAHREIAEDGSEAITLVTDRALGSTTFPPWALDDQATDASPEYSVIEFRTGEGGTGSMSLAAAVVVDADQNTVSLDTDDYPPLLTNAVRQPPPYWAREAN